MNLKKGKKKKEKVLVPLCSCVFSFPFKLSFIAQEQCRSHETSFGPLSRFFFHQLRRQRGRGTFEFGYL
jgi:hypothetical protein